MDKPFWLFDNDLALKSHSGYREAKSGDEKAAASLVSDLATDFIVRIKERLPSDVIFVAPHAYEAAGDNAIPQVFAAACAMIAKGDIDTDIVQVTRVFHTGADPMERMSLRAEFEGSVTPGSRYVLVDDVMNMGGTLAELANHIRGAGGVVPAIVILVNAGRSKRLQPDRKIIRELERRHGNEITEIFGIVPAALTANEANYLIGFRSADEIRNRVVKAKKETYLRLRSKGIERQS
ncbi:phosphoribosyltransferase [Desulfonema magnum]|uniref:Phosphoribosyltransferase domain-containing protein n=1 Tax=Desulfonema magnum TaxID=45655 RepID=A0A975GNE7_9BACT|nr:phosphoribosyltransferase [Desulfonema magnum]QTA87881.1 Uncharacterized protein dnm_039210 [Desulfonema magnum]